MCPAACSASCVERRDVHARRRDVTADAVHRQHAQREQHPLAQLGDREEVLDAVDSHVTHSCSPCYAAARALEHFRRTAGRRDLLGRLAAELVRPHGERLARSRRAPSTLTRPRRPRHQPRSRSSSGVTTVPGVERSASVSRFTTAYSTRNGLWKPRFGTRRWSGIWPPSNPRLRLKPERDLRALVAAPGLLPWPEPGPRPTRFFACLAPLGGFRFDQTSID